VSLTSVEGTYFTLYAGDEPILYYGEDGNGGVFLAPTPYLVRHRFAFARWSRENVHRWKGKRIVLQHPLAPDVERWARWLGCTVESDMVIV
jgi:hypothetical protein